MFKATVLALVFAPSIMFAGDGGQADIYGNTDKTKCYWKHQPVWSKQTDGITYYEFESRAHHLAYPYVYCCPPHK